MTDYDRFGFGGMPTPDAPRTEAPDLRAEPQTATGRRLLDALCRPWERGSVGYEGMAEEVRPAIVAIELEAAATPAPERLDVEQLRELLDTMPGLFGGVNVPDPDDPSQATLHPDFTLAVAEYLAARLRESGS